MPVPGDQEDGRRQLRRRATSTITFRTRGIGLMTTRRCCGWAGRVGSLGSILGAVELGPGESHDLRRLEEGPVDGFAPWEHAVSAFEAERGR